MHKLGDGLDESNNSEFTTFDADHDHYLFNCAAIYGGASWQKYCGSENINGPYNQSSTDFRYSIWWDLYGYLKETQLMIRPAAAN